MFWKNNKINIGMIKPTSKMSLKISCLQACGNDVEKAEKVYSFLAGDMQSLPDFDTTPPTFMQQASDTVGNIFGWVKENQDDLARAFEFIRGMAGGQQSAPPVPPVDVPPIPSPK